MSEYVAYTRVKICCIRVEDYERNFGFKNVNCIPHVKMIFISMNGTNPGLNENMETIWKHLANGTANVYISLFVKALFCFSLVLDL